MKLLFSLLAAILVAPSTGAVTLGLDTGTSVVTVGDSLTVTLVVSGLGNHAPPALGAFDVDVSYDEHRFAFTGI